MTCKRNKKASTSTRALTRNVNIEARVDTNAAIGGLARYDTVQFLTTICHRRGSRALRRRRYIIQPRVRRASGVPWVLASQRLATLKGLNLIVPFMMKPFQGIAVILLCYSG